MYLIDVARNIWCSVGLKPLFLFVFNGPLFFYVARNVCISAITTNMTIQPI